MFQPHRSPPDPNQLVIEQISFEEAKKPGTSKPVVKPKT